MCTLLHFLYIHFLKLKKVTYLKGKLNPAMHGLQSQIFNFKQFGLFYEKISNFLKLVYLVERDY